MENLAPKWTELYGVIKDYVERGVFPVRRQLDEDKDHIYIVEKLISNHEGGKTWKRGT